ncbi:MAG: hypothetical protein QXX30_00420 [Candidatus Aenigmatarchaeota archaeon]
MGFYVYINPLDGATYWTDDENKIPKLAENLTFFEEDISEVYRLEILTNETGKVSFQLRPKEDIFEEKKKEILQIFNQSFTQNITEIYPIEKQLSDKNDFDISYQTIKIENPALAEEIFTDLIKVYNTKTFSKEEFDRKYKEYENFAEEIEKMQIYVKRYFCLLSARKKYKEYEKEFANEKILNEEDFINKTNDFEQKVLEILDKFRNSLLNQ